MYNRLVALWLISLLFSGLGAAVAHAGSTKGLEALTAAQQTPAPTFTLPDHRGLPIDSTDMRGKVVVVRFWATW